MATLYITEYDRLDLSDVIPIVREPATAVQAIAFTTAATATFGASTTVVRIVSDANCHIAWDGNTATASYPRHPADVVEWRMVTAGATLSVYDGTS